MPATHHSLRTPPRGQYRFIAVIVATLLACLSALPAAASTTKSTPTTAPPRGSLRDLQKQRDAVRSAKAKQASQINALQATDDQVNAAIADLGNDVAAQTAELSDIQRDQAQAEADQNAAQASLDQSQKELAALKGNIRQEAIDAYVNGPQSQDWSIFSAEDPNDALNRRTILELRSTNSQDAAETYRSIQEDLITQREAKAAAADRARAKRAQAESKLNSLQDAQTAQQKLQDEVDNRIASSLAEADALAAVDSTLSSQITDQQNRLASQLAAQQRASAAAKAALAKAGKSVSGAPASSKPAPVFATSGGSGIVNVQGIQIAASIATNLGNLLDAARAAGFSLSGGGYRDPAAQIAVRRNNCGSSDYAIYQAPASSCRPPTAPPGTSMHERGLAVDFSVNGHTVSRSDGAFAWLKANAANYGFYNLPSESWHWSTNGN